jgi:DNA-binding MarR family transcriptional regulator
MHLALGGYRMSGPTTLQDQILVALRRITRAIDLRSRTLLQDYGLTAPQLATLNTIARLKSVTVGDIAKEIHLGKPTVTGILNRLERRRLIQRTRGDQDRRSVVVSLTPEGEQVLSTAPSLLQDEFQQELDKLKEWERTQILATLQRIADMMDASGIEAAPVLTSELADATVSQGALHLEEAPAPPGTEDMPESDRNGDDEARVTTPASG